MGHSEAASETAAPAISIETERVILRTKRLDDAEDDYAWRSDPELATFDAVPALRMDWADFLRVYKGELRNPAPRQLTLAIEDRAGVHMGNCMYYNLDETVGQTELGIMIARPEYWSQGYGTEAVTAMVRHIFASTGVSRIYLHTLTWNYRAQKAFQKSGFETVGEVLRNGHNFAIMEQYRWQFEAAGDNTAPPTPDA